MRVQSTTGMKPPLAGNGLDARLPWRVALFHPNKRESIAATAGDHPALCDLAESYPALLFALSSGFATAERRQATIDAVIAGEPLECCAELLGLAWWTRKLPAAALREALPAFPIDADFSRRMASLVPAGVNAAAQWLTVVSEAVPAGGRQYALWIARHGVALAGTLNDSQRQAFHAWVWLSWHPGTYGHALVRRPWASDLGIKRVMEEFGVFLSRVALADALGEGALGGFVNDQQVHGLTFRPLRSAFDYIQAAAALDNCLEQYADRLKRGTTAVAVIEDHGDMIGCVEVGPHPTESAMPAIVQLRIAKNRRAPASLWSAAYAWLAACDMRPLVPLAMAPSDLERARGRANLWGGYLKDLATGPGCAAMYQRALMALDGEPPSLDQPNILRRPVRAQPWGFGGAHETLLDRLVHLTGRGPARRFGREG